MDNQYDHYKVTNELNRDAQKLRDRYFMFISILLFALLAISAYPAEIMIMLQEGIIKASGVNYILGKEVLQSFVWFMLLWNSLRYYQKVVYIERLYHYTSTLEHSLTITRESDDYLQNYPSILNFMHSIYQWVFPLLVIACVVGKCILEIIERTSIVFYCFDLCMALLLVVATVLYWCFLRKTAKLDRCEVELINQIDDAASERP